MQNDQIQTIKPGAIFIGDAHAGKWHRQVSFLGAAEIEAFRARGATVSHGDFGENIVAEGFSFIRSSTISCVRTSA